MSNEVIVITGSRGSGKSTLAATLLPPSEIDTVYYHDSENSANRLRAQLQAAGLDFGRYVDLKSRFSNLPGDDDLLALINQGKLPWTGEYGRSSLTDYYLYILDDLTRNLTPGKYKVYVHDTLEKLEAGMAAWVESNKRKAGVTTLAYGKLWSEGVYPLYENLLASIFGRGVETVILCSHLKTPWEGGRPVVGKVQPSGKKLLYRLSSLMLWLVGDRRNADGAPAGIVLKERYGRLEPVGDEWKIQRMLPERIPHCTWADISRYLETGCDLANLSNVERLTDAERSMISELLSDEQMRLMVLGAEADLEKLRTPPVLSTGEFAPPRPPTSESPQVDTQRNQIRGMRESGTEPTEIAQQLGIPLPVVLEYLK